MRTKLTQVDGSYLATRQGTPTLWTFGVTALQARTSMARQLRSWRRYQRERRTCSQDATCSTLGA